MSQINIRNLSNENDDGSPEIVGVSTFSTTSYFVPPKGTTLERPSDCEPGSIRFNTDTANLEYFRGKTLGWSQFELVTPNLGGGTGSNTGVGARGLIINGFNAGGNQTNTIDFVTISTLGNAADFGDMQDGRVFCSSASNAIRGIIVGDSYPITNVITFITIATLGTDQDFGDMNSSRDGSCSAASPTRIVTMGGRNPSNSNEIDYGQIMTTGNFIDYGDLTGNYAGQGGCSNGHGGL